MKFAQWTLRIAGTLWPRASGRVDHGHWADRSAPGQLVLGRLSGPGQVRAFLKWQKSLQSPGRAAISQWQGTEAKTTSF